VQSRIFYIGTDILSGNVCRSAKASAKQMANWYLLKVAGGAGPFAENFTSGMLAARNV
jgi:hypothetical protein